MSATTPNAHDFTEADIREVALTCPCPTCGAKAGVRCRILTPGGWSGSGRTKVDVRPNPCPDRATVAWRKMREAS